MVSDLTGNYATGVDLQSLESLDIKNESDTVSGQDLSTLVQNEVDMEDGVEQDSGNDLVVVASDTKAKEGSEEGALRDNNNGMYCYVSRGRKIQENGICSSVYFLYLLSYHHLCRMTFLMF